MLQTNIETKREIKNPEELISKLKLSSELNLAGKVENVIKWMTLSTEQKWQKLKDWLAPQDSQRIVEIFKDEDPKLKEKLIINARLDNLEQRIDNKTQPVVPQSPQSAPEAKQPEKKEASITEHPLDWARENKLEAWLWVAWTVIAGAVWYKLFTWMFSSSKWGEDTKKDEKWNGFFDWIGKELHIPWFVTEWLKHWWILGAIVALWAGLFLWKDKVKEWFSKYGPESKEMKEAYESFTKTVSESGAKVSVKSETIKKIKTENVKAFIDPTNSVISNLKNKWKWLFWKALWFFWRSDVAEMADLKEEDTTELEAVKAYLTDRVKNKKDLAIWEKTTIEDVVKAMSGNSELKAEVDKDSSHKVELITGTAALAAVWTVAALVPWQVNAAKTDEKKDHKNEYTWSMPAIIWARVYQWYHGVQKPYNSLSVGEKNILKWSIRDIFSRITSIFGNKNYDFKQAQSSLWGLEELLASQNNSNLDEKAKLIWQEFESGKWIHPKFQNINLKNANLTPEQYYRFLAEQEHNLSITTIESEINAIKWWPETFKNFQLSKVNPETFLERLHWIENRRYMMFQKMTWANVVEAGEWKNFGQMSRELNNVINEKNSVVWSITWEVDKLTKEYQNTSTSPARKIQIETEVKWHLNKIKGIEDELRAVTNRFVTQNEKQLINIMDSTNQKTWRRTIKNWLPNLKWDTRATDLFDLDLVNPKKKFFRFSTSWFWNKFMLLWIWAGTLLSAWDWDKKELNKEHFYHTAKRVWYWFVPLYGTYLDSMDMLQAFRQWQMLSWFANMWAMVASWAWDTLLAMSLIPWWMGAPLWLWAKSALSSLRTFLKSWIAVKSVTESTEVLKWAKTVLTLENAAWKVTTQEVLDFERLSSQLAEWSSNVTKSSKEITTMILKKWMVLWTATALWLWVWVPLVSYWLNKAWLLEQEKDEAA